MVELRREIIRFGMSGAGPVEKMNALIRRIHGNVEQKVVRGLFLSSDNTLLSFVSFVV